MGMPKSERYWRWAAVHAQRPKHKKWRFAKAAYFGVDIGKHGSGETFRTSRRFRKPNRSQDWVTLGPELSRISADLMEAVAPALTEAFDDVMAEWAGEVAVLWPQHRSGMSGASIRLNYIVRDKNTFVAQLWIVAPYAQTIIGGPAHKLVWSKVEKNARKIRDRALNELVKV